MLKTYEIKEEFMQLIANAISAKTPESMKKAKEFYCITYFTMVETNGLEEITKKLFNEIDAHLDAVFTHLCYMVVYENKGRKFAEAFYNVFICDNFDAVEEGREAKQAVNNKINEIKELLYQNKFDKFIAVK
jgi:hypothetical protein